jgi:hypothetical protein
MKAKKHLKKDIYPHACGILLAAAVVIYFILILIKIPLYSDMWWDSAVYVEMGKYIMSGGISGLWEDSRPLVWPIILGTAWKIGLNPIVWGKIITYLMGAATIILTYFIGKETFGKKTGLIASILLAFTPIFFLTNAQLLSELPSTFFAILGVYLFIKKKYFISGLIMGIAFMTRFLQMYTLMILLVFIAIIYYKKEKQIIKNCISFISGSLIFTLPYLILNTILYKNPLYPFIIQGYLARYTGWMWWEPMSFYFTGLLKENYLFIFALIGAIIIIKNRNKKQLAILSILALYAIFYSIIAHKEMRFLISLLPYLFLAAAYGIVKLTDMVLVRKARIPAIALLLLAFMIMAFPQYKAWSRSEIYEPYYEYLNSFEENEGIWITNPLFILETNKKAEPIYYWTFDAERAREMQEKMSGAKHILLNGCDIPCQPWNEECPEEKQNFISMIQENFEQIYHKENNGCDYYIFATKTQA